jgi:hypothetical protein
MEQLMNAIRDALRTVQSLNMRRFASKMCKTLGVRCRTVEEYMRALHATGQIYIDGRYGRIYRSRKSYESG